MTAPPAWPLHPPPGPYEPLRTYVTRLARFYDVSFYLFCGHALHIPLTDREALSLSNPSDAVLKRLSVGVGVPVDDLRAMQLGKIWTRIMAEIHAHMETEDGRRELESRFRPVTEGHSEGSGGEVTLFKLHGPRPFGRVVQRE